MNQFPGTKPTGDDPSAEHDHEPASMSLLGGIAQAEEPTYNAETDSFEVASEKTSGGRINQGVMVVVAVALVAGASLYLMRVSQGDMTADAATAQTEAKIEQWLGKLTVPGAMGQEDPMHKAQIQSLFQDTDQIVQIFNGDLTGHQVPIEYVKKNPFRMHWAKKTVSVMPGEDPNIRAERERQVRIKKLKRELDKLTLQSVVSMRSNPVAAINGDFYRKGDVVGSFTVVAVSAKHMAVKLTAEDESFILRMVDALNQ